MNFYEWMMQYKGRSTPRGDLAGDMARTESSFPKNGSRDEIISYLESHNACKQAIQVFKGAWQSYQKSQSPQ